jgi:hypothetical protein
MHTFGENIVFGFVFGSAAKGDLKICDLNTFICLKEDDQVAIQEYVQGLTLIHQKHKLKVGENSPAKIVTLKTLRETMDSLEGITISVDKIMSEEKIDQIFTLLALKDKKAGFIGDGKLMFSFIKDLSQHLDKWRDQIIKQLEKSILLPVHLCDTFAGFSKKEIIKKLSSESSHLAIQIGLSSLRY